MRELTPREIRTLIVLLYWPEAMEEDGLSEELELWDVGMRIGSLFNDSEQMRLHFASCFKLLREDIKLFMDSDGEPRSLV